MPVPTALTPERRRTARQMAEAHTPDSVILGALRADVYDSTEPGLFRDECLAALQVMHPDDVAELGAYRDRGRARLHLVLYACAMSYQLNPRKERLDLAPEGADTSSYDEVDAKAASAAMFLARVVLALDPKVFREEAEKEAARFASMSDDEKRLAWLRIGAEFGVDDETTAEVGARLGLTVVTGGAA
jgi:hypothetical protein